MNKSNLKDLKQNYILFLFRTAHRTLCCRCGHGCSRWGVLGKGEARSRLGIGLPCTIVDAFNNSIGGTNYLSIGRIVACTHRACANYYATCTNLHCTRHFAFDSAILPFPSLFSAASQINAWKLCDSICCGWQRFEGEWQQQ